MSPSDFGDAEAKHLGLFSELTWLVLNDTKLTDEGLQHLFGLKKLQRLDIEGTAVTEAGVKELQRVLPKLDVATDHGLYRAGVRL